MLSLYTIDRLMDRNKPQKPLGGRTPDAFLQEYWGRRPLLVRGAFDESPLELEAEAYAGLACEEGVEARLIVGTDNERLLRHGPFSEEDFTSLPESGWTLLVQSVERWFPEAMPLLEAFRFLPNVRFDDLMVSIAANGGGVGAHIDRYDVFLIQLAGQRRWRIEQQARPDDLQQEDEEGLLDFVADEEWLLEPGDLLYLPPRFAHEGTAVGPCITASVGFRAPSWGSVLAGTLREIAEGIDPQCLLPLSGESFAEDPGRLPEDWIEHVRTRLLATLDEHTIATAIGRTLTEPRGEPAAAPEIPLEIDELREAIAAGAGLERVSIHRLSWRHEHGTLTLFVGGEAISLPQEAEVFAQALCARGPIDSGRLRLDEDDYAVRLVGWINDGHLALD